MNIFILDTDPKLAAQYHLDKHAVKMPLEATQLLCTALHLTGQTAPYKPCYQNHPCSLWVREGLENFNWLREHGLALCAEYTFRYDRTHACFDVINNLQIPVNLPRIPLTPFAQVVPDDCKGPDVVQAYRKYYEKKKDFAVWTRREPPEWFPKELILPRPDTIVRKVKRRFK